jgi:hypothetical protein
MGRERWVVERTFAWLHDFGRLRIRWEVDPELHLAFLYLGCAVICQRMLSADAQVALITSLVLVAAIARAAAILIRDPPPPPNRHRHLRDHAVGVKRVDLALVDPAAMPPVVPEVEHVAELHAGLELARDLELRVIKPHNVEREGVIRVADQPPVRQLELMQVGESPPCERRIDRLCQLRERVRRPDDHHSPRRRIALDTTPAQQLNLDRQPRPSHQLGGYSGGLR